MIKIFRLFILTIIVLSFYVFAEEKEELFDKVVMVVNGEPILKSDLDFAKNWYNLKDDKEVKEKLIDSVLISQHAKKLGISVTAAEIDNAVSNIAKANGVNDIETFKKKLAESGISYNKLREFLSRDLIVNKFLHFYLRDKITQGIVEGTVEDVKQVRVIFISKNREDYKDIVAKLEKELNKENFPSYASKYSDDKYTAENKGLLGEVKKGDLVEDIEKELFSHKVGDIFKVDSKEGTYFVLIEKEGKKLIPKEQLNDKDLQKFKQEYELYLKKLREQAVIQYLE